MDFRPLTLADLDAVMALERSLTNSLAWEPATEEDQIAIIREGNNFGVFENGTLIGKVGFFDTITEGWEIDGMIIASTRRGQKYGSKLFEYAVNAIINKVHPDRFTLYTHPDNTAALSLYMKRGFTQRDMIKDKYGPGKHRIKLTKSLA